jgi:hypothetical protein
MQKEDTASGRSPQGHPNLRASADNTSGRSERGTFQSLAAVKFDVSSGSGRMMRDGHEVSQHPTANVANEIANILKRSVARLGTFAYCKYRGGNVL